MAADRMLPERWRPVRAERLPTPDLALYLVGGALIGAGAGAVFKGTTGLVLDATAPEDRLVMTSHLLIAAFVGISIPVIGAGVALSQGVTAPDTVARLRDRRRAGYCHFGLGASRALAEKLAHQVGPRRFVRTTTTTSHEGTAHDLQRRQ